MGLLLLLLLKRMIICHVVPIGAAIAADDDDGFYEGSGMFDVVVYGSVRRYLPQIVSYLFQGLLHGIQLCDNASEE